MNAVDVFLVLDDRDTNKLPLGKTLDTIPDVLEVTRDYVSGPLKETYPALYTFTEFGLQAIESFMIAITDHTDYTANIGLADLSDIPLLDRELAGKLAANFLTALRISRGRQEEVALNLLGTQYTEDWRNASFTVEPGSWLIRHLRGETDPIPTSIQA